MPPYDLTPAAEADLREIARYTLRRWGARQQQRYAHQLAACFQRIAEGRARSKTFSERFPQVRVARCQHHYVFYIYPEGHQPLMLAVLHEQMDLLARLGERLSG
jgi:toxin ParE1/3/4